MSLYNRFIPLVAAFALGCSDKAPNNADLEAYEPDYGEFSGPKFLQSTDGTLYYPAGTDRVTCFYRITGPVPVAFDLESKTVRVKTDELPETSRFCPSRSSPVTPETPRDGPGL